MRRVLPVILLLVLLSACAGTGSDYLYVAPHVDTKTEDAPVEGMTADSIEAFESILLRLIESGVEQGTIRLEAHPNDIKSDISTALMDITTNDPLGAYAVAYMSYDYTKILNYYDVTVSITYRRTADEISAVRSASSRNEFEEMVISAVSRFSPVLAVRLPYYHTELYDVPELLTAANLNDPLTLFSVPKVEVSAYPDTGPLRVVELRFEYSESALTLREKAEALKGRAEALISECAGLSDLEALALFFEHLQAEVTFLPDREDDLSLDYHKDESFTAYGALLSKQAVSEGFALALQTLCRLRGIDSMAISGRYAGVFHMWNLVKLDGSYYHIDASLKTEDGEKDFFLLPDSEMEEAHHWNRSLYPACVAETPEMPPSG